MAFKPRMYYEFASWFPLITAPADYTEEAQFYLQVLCDYSEIPLHTLLELGSGGGNNAFHLKRHFQMTLVDLSPDMLAISQQLNPECEHVVDDMRTIRSGRQFDAVFIHDAISYMTTPQDLRATLISAYEHCRLGGVALFTPDKVKDTFRPSQEHGGHDSDSRSLRYLQWTWDPDPADTTYVADFTYLLQEQDSMQHAYDRHVLGLFERGEWVRMIAQAGFKPLVVPFSCHSHVLGCGEVFVGMKSK